MKIAVLSDIHGNLTAFNAREELLPDKYPERLEKALNYINESVLICGHTHRQWSKKLHNKLIFNPGNLQLVPNCIWDKAEKICFN